MNKVLFYILLLALSNIEIALAQYKRPREMGIEIGIFKPGKWNAITDVYGVEVGHETIIQGNNVRTGVTIIKPHDGNIFDDKVMAAVHVTNGFGKALGFTQINELGTIETPIALTNTLNVFLVANAIVAVSYTHLTLPTSRAV